MPCRAAPPPPPPPHSTLDLTPSPASLSNPLVYRLRTCCLQEFLPRVSINQHSTPSTSSSRVTPTATCSCTSTSSSSPLPSHTCLNCPSTSSSTLNHTTIASISNNHRRHSVMPAGRRSRSKATQLCALFDDNNTSNTTISSAYLILHNNNNSNSNSSSNDSDSNGSNNHNTPHYPSAPLSFSRARLDRIDHSDHDPLFLESEESLPVSSLSAALNQWQPPMSSIPLAQLQSDLAHRFLKWALSEKLVQDDVPEHEQQIPMQTQEGQEEQQPLPRQYGHTSDAIDPSMFSNDHYEQAHGQQQQQQQQQQQPVFEATSIAAAGLDWAAAHDLVWPEGDYFMAQKTFIREGVAHLKRGRRYIFVEPVLGPATTFLYPKWTEDPLVEEGYEAGVGGDESVHESGPRYEHSANAGGNDAALEQHQQEQQQEQQQQQQQDKNDDALTTALSAEEPSDDNSSSLSSSGENGVGQGEKQQGEEEEGEGDDKHAGKGENEEGVEMVKQGDDDDEETTADRAHAEQLLSDTGALLAFDMERVEKEETDENAPNSNHSSNNSNNNNNNNNAATSAPAANTTIAAASMNNNNNSSNNATVTNSINSTHASTISNGNATTGISSSTSTSANSQPSMFANRHNHSYHDEDAHHHHAGTACHLLNTSSEFLEPYSPLLDPSTDGQDQFEYGLYELQYIPKVQYLLPHQFLPTRQSFIVHLDEDRPTLASPVPIHSKRSECRCQLMMRKALMQRDLLQVWPQVAPIRTLLEQQQEAEEEARMMEIKQKVQMMTKNWRETLHTQVVTCG